MKFTLTSQSKPRILFALRNQGFLEAMNWSGLFVLLWQILNRKDPFLSFSTQMMTVQRHWDPASEGERRLLLGLIGFLW
jgi:hypothetical protein